MRFFEIIRDDYQHENLGRILYPLIWVIFELNIIFFFFAGVVPEIQCEVKRREKKAQREKGKPNSTTNGSPDLMMADTPVIKTEPNTTQPHSDKATPTNGVKPISPEQEELIHRLVYFQNEYEQPSDEDLKRISVSRKFFKILIFQNSGEAKSPQPLKV